MFYAANMNCSSPNTRTMVVHGNVGGSTGGDVIYDIANAAASPYDTRSAAGQTDSQGTAGTSSCVLNSAATDHAPDITPTVAPGIAIVVAEEGTGPRCALVGTGYVADMGWYTGATDNSTLMDNGNGYGHYYYSSTSTIDFHWLWANGTQSGGYHLAAAFKQASGPSPATPTFSPVAGKQLFKRQTYTITNMLGEGSRVAMEMDWVGVTAVQLQNLPAGSEMRDHVAVFLEFRDGRIARQQLYDCFEPW